ncbi:TLDc domain-containing protein [Entamoeba marina]
MGSQCCRPETEEVDTISNENQIKEGISTLKRWCGLNQYNIIFDSDIDGNVVLNMKIMNRKHLYFIHFDDYGNIFGGYVNVTIDTTDDYITDPKAFVFSLFRNNELSQNKYCIENIITRLLLLNCNRDMLYSFGQGDISISLNKLSSCIPTSFNYSRTQYPLTSNMTGISIERLCILEMFN